MFDIRAWNILKEAKNNKKKTSSKMGLNTFKRIDMNDANIRKYKSSNKGLSHIRTGRDYKGYIYIDNNDEVMGFINMRKSDKYIQAIEIDKKYQGNGLGKALLHELMKMGAKRLSVNKKNEKAINMYKKKFSIEKEDEYMYYMVLDSSKCLSESIDVRYAKSFNFSTSKKDNIMIFEDYTILYEADDDLGPSDYGDEENIDAEEGAPDDDTGGGDDLEAQDYGDEETTDDGTEEDGEDIGADDTTEDDIGEPGDKTGEGDDTVGDENPEDEQTDNTENSDDKENNKFLINDYIELYRRLEEIIEKLNISEQAKLNRDPVFNKVRDNLEKLKKVTYDYITTVFNNESYVSNLYQFNMIIQNINVNVELLNNSYIARSNQKNEKDMKKKNKRK